MFLFFLFGRFNFLLNWQIIVLYLEYKEEIAHLVSFKDFRLKFKLFIFKIKAMKCKSLLYLTENMFSNNKITICCFNNKLVK